MKPVPTFKLVVIANNIDWKSLPDKLEAVWEFYRSVCDLRITIVHTSMQPVFNNTYPELAPLYVIDRGWYDVNVATPHAGDADIIMFITAAQDHIGKTTYGGYMSFNNVGPWETTVFATDENYHAYMQGKDLGDNFTLVAEHELSHAFYYMVGKRDDTHVHFPVNQPSYSDSPMNVLADFDFTTRYAILKFLNDKLVAALTMLRILRKRNIATVGSIARS